jgi:hypothetical protein
VLRQPTKSPDRYLHHGRRLGTLLYCTAMSDRSNNVVQLATRRPRAKAPSGLKIWSCSCGSLTFFLYSDGSVQCSDCRNHSRKIKCAAAVESADRR